MANILTARYFLFSFPAGAALLVHVHDPVQWSIFLVELVDAGHLKQFCCVIHYRIRLIFYISIKVAVSQFSV